MRYGKIIIVIIVTSVCAAFLIGLQILAMMALNGSAQVKTVEHPALTASDVELCKQYRKWQLQPEIKGATTGMDAICEKIGQ